MSGPQLAVPRPRWAASRWTIVSGARRRARRRGSPRRGPRRGGGSPTPGAARRGRCRRPRPAASVRARASGRRRGRRSPAAGCTGTYWSVTVDSSADEPAALAVRVGLVRARSRTSRSASRPGDDLEHGPDPRQVGRASSGMSTVSSTRDRRRRRAPCSAASWRTAIPAPVVYLAADDGRRRRRARRRRAGARAGRAPAPPSARPSRRSGRCRSGRARATRAGGAASSGWTSRPSSSSGDRGRRPSARVAGAAARRAPSPTGSWSAQTSKPCRRPGQLGRGRERGRSANASPAGRRPARPAGERHDRAARPARARGSSNGAAGHARRRRPSARSAPGASRGRVKCCWFETSTRPAARSAAEPAIRTGAARRLCSHIAGFGRAVRPDQAVGAEVAVVGLRRRSRRRTPSGSCRRAASGRGRGPTTPR